MCALYAPPQRPTSSTADAAHPRTSELGWWWWLLSGGEQKSAQKTPSLAWNYKVPVYVISVLELLLSTGRNRAATTQSRSFNIHRIFFRIAKFSNLQKFISCSSSNTFFVKRNVKNVRASRDLNEDDMCLLCGVYVPKGFSSVREKRGKGEAASNLGQCRWFIPDDSRRCEQALPRVVLERRPTRVGSCCLPPDDDYDDGAGNSAQSVDAWFRRRVLDFVPR